MPPDRQTISRFLYNMASIDDILESTHGNGRFQQLIIFWTGLWAWFWFAAPIMITTLLTKQLKDFFHISDLQLAEIESLTFVGWFIGGFILAKYSDIYGRKPLFNIGLFIILVASFASTMCTSAIMFTICRFFVGFGVGGFSSSSYVYMVEFLLPQQRGPVTSFVSILWAIGVGVLSWIAFSLRESSWQLLINVTSAPACISLLFYPYLVETPRFLSTNKKEEDLEKVIDLICKVNGVDTHTIARNPLYFTPYIEKSEYQAKKIVTEENYYDTIDPYKGATHSQHFEQKESFKDLFIPSLRSTTLILFFLWFTSSLVYYGLSIKAGTLTGNLYINSAALALVEVPSYILCYCLADVVGRKPLLIFSLIESGLVLVISAIPLGWGDMSSTICAILGKFGIAGAFAMVYVVSGECFPTTVRGIGVGACSAMSRLGGIFAPMLARGLTTEYSLLCFGIFGLIAAFLTLYIPETTGKHLQDRIEDSNIQ